MVAARLIAHRAAQPEHPDAVMDKKPVFNADAALRRRFFIAVIVVAMDIQDGGMGIGCKERKVLRVQIAAG